MYENVGSKIKTAALVISIIFMVITVVISLVILIITNQPIWLLLMFLGPLVIWLQSLVMFGFGEIVESVCEIERKLPSFHSRLTTKPQSTFNTFATADVQTKQSVANKNVKPFQSEMSDETTLKEKSLKEQTLTDLLMQGVITFEEFSEQMGYVKVNSDDKT